MLKYFTRLVPACPSTNSCIYSSLWLIARLKPMNMLRKRDGEWTAHNLFPSWFLVIGGNYEPTIWPEFLFQVFSLRLSWFGDCALTILTKDQRWALEFFYILKTAFKQWKTINPKIANAQLWVRDWNYTPKNFFNNIFSLDFSAELSM